MLTKYVIDWLQEKGVKDIHLLASTKAHPIYERLGFKDTDEMFLSI